MLAIALLLAAAFIADTVWFQLRSHRGKRVLRFLCRISLEPDSCVRRTENAFLKYGVSSLLISKFVPGLNAVAAPSRVIPEAGICISWRSMPWSVLWSGAYMALGYLFSDQLETGGRYTPRMGSNLRLLVVALFSLWIGWKFIQRRRFLKNSI